MLAPLPHQLEGADHFAKSHKGLLADEMGLGKGGTAFTWLQRVGAKRTLLTGPYEITSNLRNEVPKWIDDRPVIDLRGHKRDDRSTVFELLNHFDSFIALLNIEAWRGDQSLITRLVRLQLDSVVIDEAHHVNNGRTLSYKGLREIVYAFNKCPYCSQLIVPTYTCRRTLCTQYDERFPHRWCLRCGKVAAKVSVPRCEVCLHQPTRSVENFLAITGTPVLNRCEEFFWLESLWNPTLTSKKRYLDEHCRIDFQGRHVWTDRGRARLTERIAPHYLARKREDAGIELPPQTVQVREYEFDKANYPEQWKAYERVQKQFKLDLESETVGITEVVVQLLRLRQMLVWPAGIEGVNVRKSFKLDLVTDLTREFLEAGQRIVVFSHFREPLRELERRLGAQSVVYDGDTPKKLREAIRADFEDASHPPRWNAALCNYRSAGEGLNLVGATQAIVLDKDWSPGRNDQAWKRLDRIGQKQATGIHVPTILGTVDVWMDKLNDFKAGIDSESLRASILEAMEVA
ncbi:DEAD/DEAH box helicase [Nonomuraea sp. NPDC050451]|uniref:DEAD/DEAH box helicase n=1 Tax=Nonomuraea sp. NPDC050451 TaxID=3364364 RepID=UPI0037A4331C